MKIKKEFRKLIVKRFALSYIGKNFATLRASTIIYPLMVINGSLIAFGDGLNWYAFVPLLISFYFGFIYFRIYPVSREELDDSQKLQYDQFYKYN